MANLIKILDGMDEKRIIRDLDKKKVKYEIFDSDESFESFRDKDFCYQCILAGVNLKESAYPREEMVEGHESSDLICSHCYQTEEDSGPENYAREDLDKAFETIETLKKFLG